MDQINYHHTYEPNRGLHLSSLSSSYRIIGPGLPSPPNRWQISSPELRLPSSTKETEMMK